MTLRAQPGIFQGRGDFFKWVVNQDTMILRKKKVFDIAFSLFWEFMKLKYWFRDAHKNICVEKFWKTSMVHVVTTSISCTQITIILKFLKLIIISWSSWNLSLH